LDRLPHICDQQRLICAVNVRYGVPVGTYFGGGTPYQQAVLVVTTPVLCAAYAVDFMNLLLTRPSSKCTKTCLRPGMGAGPAGVAYDAPHAPQPAEEKDAPSSLP